MNELRETYEKQGFLVHPHQEVPQQLLDRVIPRMDAVLNEDYETGRPPMTRWWNPGDDPNKLKKIDLPHLSDSTIHELARSEEVGRVIAEIFDADLVQLWANQLLVKPPGGADGGTVGWHQDEEYWQHWWTGEVFTAWVAVTDVTAEIGPLRFVRGSHKWGFLDAGDFFGEDMDELKARFAAKGREWDEVPAEVPAGGFSIHHPLVVHGSGANSGKRDRRGFALHLRTEKSELVDNDDPLVKFLRDNLDDPGVCPVLFKR